MKHFDLFSGYGGFTIALSRAYANIQNLPDPKEHEHEATDSASMGQSRMESNSTSRLGDTHTKRAYANYRELLPSQAAEDLPEVSSEPESGQARTIGFSEIDKYASAVLKYHWPEIKNYGDISKINWAEVPDFDLLTGGSPCQDLSIAGKRAGIEGARSGLFYEYMRAVREKKPKYFIWENVKGALSSSQGRDFALVINEMAEAGYSLWWQILNAKDFGVPQNRERIFVVGFRDGSPREVFFERASGGENIVENNAGQIYEQTRKLSDAFRIRNTEGVSATLKGLGGGMGAKTGLYAIPEATKQGYAIAEEGDSINLAVPNSKTRRGRVDKGIAQTLDTGMQQHTLTDCRIRRLTPVECERLMGLPDNHTQIGRFDGPKTFGTEFISDSQRYKMCGNGVVVNVVEELINQLIIC